MLEMERQEGSNEMMVNKGEMMVNKGEMMN
jgi:hypothetical protein